MRILCTGSAGFIGSHVVDKLLAAKHDVLVVDNFSTGKMENLKLALDLHGDALRIEHCDITNLNDLRKVMLSFQPIFVVHLAAQSAITTSLDTPTFDLAVNAGGMLNVIKASSEAGVRRVIFSSTSAIYKSSNRKLGEGHAVGPESPYGISKLAAEFYLTTMYPNFVILRFGNVYGPRQVPIGENQVVPRMIRHFQYGDKFLVFGSGNQTRDFVYVEDVAHAVSCALSGRKGIYNIASGKSVSVNTIASHLEMLYDVLGYKWEHAPSREEREKVMMDISAAAQYLSWRPAHSISEGLQKTVAWWKERADDQGLHLA